MIDLKLLIEIIGWLVAAIILASHILLSLGKLAVPAAVYQRMNVVGASGFELNSGSNCALPSAGLNTIWALMGYSRCGAWRARAKANGEATNSTS